MVNGPNIFLIIFVQTTLSEMSLPFNITHIYGVSESSLILRRVVPLRALEPRPVRTSLMRGWMMGDSATNGR